MNVFYFSLMTPIGSAASGGAAAHGHPGGTQPTNTAVFLPFGESYRGGVSLATGWLAGSLGGAERIVVSQLTAPGAVKVYSSGSALHGGPAMYLDSAMAHSHRVEFAEVGGFSPFGEASGVSVATTSTISGADLLVSGVSSEDRTVHVVRYQFVRSHATAATLRAVPLGRIVSATGSLAYGLGGD